MENYNEFKIPHKYWISLREACDLKNLNYKTACNRTYLQPNQGIPDGIIGGRKMFRRETIENWVTLTDADLGKAANHD